MLTDNKILPANSDEVESALGEYREKQENIISKVTQNEPLLEGDFGLRGVNVYNAWFYKNYLYTTYFLSYEENEDQKILHGHYLLEMDNGRIKKIYENQE